MGESRFAPLSKPLTTPDLIETSARVAELSRLVSDLPPPNYALLRALTAHLILIVRNAPVNKMTLRNIGIVFSPTLGIPAGIFSELVSHFGAIFDDEPMDDASDGAQGEGNAAAAAAAVGESGGALNAPLEGSRRNRNSVLYQKVGIDTMLGLGGRALDPGGSARLIYVTEPSRAS
jgi:RalA-binding protein 1